MSLVGASEGKADFSLALVVLVNPHGTIAYQQSRFLEFDGDLKIFSWHPGLDLFHLLNEGARLGCGDPLPALVSGDFGVIAIRHEERTVRILKVSQAQSGRLDCRERLH